MYRTLNFARIVCVECGQEVDTLSAGKTFDGIKTHNCPKAPKKPARKPRPRVKKAVEDEA